MPNAHEILEQLYKSFPFPKPRSEQEKAFEHLAPWLERLFIQRFEHPLYFGLDLPTGCHAAGTKVLMYSGVLKKVEDIVVGDKLMGADSLPRTVLRLYRGRESMYRILPVKGESFVVNKSHVLSLRRTGVDSNHRKKLSPQGNKRRRDFKGHRSIVNISVKEYLNKSKTFKHTHKLWRTGVNFPINSDILEIPPYILGVWLGDGSADRSQITNPDPEILKAWKEYGLTLGLLCKEKEKPGCISSNLMKDTSLKENPLTKLLRLLNIWENKHIPFKYLVASEKDRKELLAGLLDTDGSLGSGGGFDFISIKKQISEGVVFLARSLGLAAYIQECKKHCQNNFEGTYYRVGISGDCTIIPTRVFRKQANKRKQIKDVLVTGFQIEELPEDDYFGFELNSDHLYLLEDFTVNHNSGKSPLAITIALAVRDLYKNEFGIEPDKRGYDLNQVWIVTQNKILQDQYLEDFDKYIFDLRGLGNYKCHKEKGSSCGESKCGRIRSKDNETYPKACTFNCEYDHAKDLARKAPIVSLNIAKALNLLKDPKLARPVLMLFDEGHEVEAALDNESTISISPDELQKLGLIFPHYFNDLKNIEEIKTGLEQLIKDCIPLKEAEEGAEKRDVKRYKKLESITNKAAEVLNNINQSIEYVSCSEEKLELKPLQIHKVFEKTFTFPTAFLSATLLSKEGFQSITGIKNLDWFSCTSPFPVENRPIRFFWRFGAPALNYENLNSQLPILVQRVESLLKKHSNDRGIIHTHTYKIAERLYQDLYIKHGDRLLFPKTAKEQKDALERHARNPNSVLISPSMTQGVDLKEELCRFAIMCKVPWLPTNDPVVKARMEMNPAWYTYKTAMTTVQAPGRGVRSATDYAETYLIDPGFARFFGMAAQHLPKWFTNSLIKKPCGNI